MGSTNNSAAHKADATHVPPCGYLPWRWWWKIGIYWARHKASSTTGGKNSLAQKETSPNSALSNIEKKRIRKVFPRRNTTYPLVLGPALAIERYIGPSCFKVKFSGCKDHDKNALRYKVRNVWSWQRSLLLFGRTIGELRSVNRLSTASVKVGKITSWHHRKTNKINIQRDNVWLRGKIREPRSRTAFANSTKTYLES